MIIDIIFTAVAYFLTVSGFAMWIFKKKPDRVPCTRRTIFSLALRTAPLYLFMLYVCQSTGISVIVGVAILAICLIALIDPLGIVPTGIISVGFVYAIQQWILGWPDRYLLINETTLESNQNKPRQPDLLIGRVARVVTPLRPSGKVLIDDRELDASCEFGFLDSGNDVEIIDKKGFTFIVKPIKE